MLRYMLPSVLIHCVTRLVTSDLLTPHHLGSHNRGSFDIIYFGGQLGSLWTPLFPQRLSVITPGDLSDPSEFHRWRYRHLYLKCRLTVTFFW